MNDIYKKLRYLVKMMGLDDKDVFQAGGLDVSNSQLHAWRVGESHANYRRISQDQLGAYCEGLNAIYEQKSFKKIEGYLEHKYALTANLDAGHPYKSSPPIGFSKNDGVR